MSDDEARRPGHDLVAALLKDGTLSGITARLGHHYPDAGPDVEDAVAEAVVRFLARAGKGETKHEPAAWITTVARNEVKKRLERRTNRHTGHDPETDGRQVDSAEDTALRDETFKFVLSVLDRWESARMRVVTRLFLEAAYLGEPLSYLDAAETASAILGEDVPVTSIGKTYGRGCARLAEELRELLGQTDGTVDLTHPKDKEVLP